MSRVTYFVRMNAREGKAEEVRETLLINYRNIREEQGNVAYSPHRSTDDPDEFWICETWESQEAVDTHENSARFEEYKSKLRPLVDCQTVLFGNAAPFAALGFEA